MSSSNNMNPAESETQQDRRAQDAELLEVFDLFDQNGKGVMCCPDMRVAFRILGLELSREQYHAITTLYSEDQKNITKSAFLEIAHDLLSKRSGEERKQALEAAFGLIDSSGAGYVTAKQMAKVVQATEDICRLKNDSAEAPPTSASVVSPPANQALEDELHAMFLDLGVANEAGEMSRADFLSLLLPSQRVF